MLEDATTNAPRMMPIAPATGYHRRFSSADTDTIGFLRELDVLLTAENTNGYTFQPSLYAYHNARAYLQALSRVVGRSLPQPELIPDGEGGIDIEWENGQKRLAISCRARHDQRDCIYWRQLGVSGYEARDVTLLKMVERLRWLARA